MEKITHIWFDMEGTLLEMTPTYKKAAIDFCYTVYADVVGRDVDDALKKEFDALLAIHKRKSLVFASLGKDKKFYPNRLVDFDYAAVVEEDLVVQTCITYLKKQGKVLGLYTSLPKKTVLIILEALGLDANDFMILSGDDVTKTKPDPEGYEKIVALSGVDASHIIFVGDSETKDMAPAKSIGLHTILVRAEEKSVHADYVCTDFEVLVKLFEDLL